MRFCEHGSKGFLLHNLLFFATFASAQSNPEQTNAASSNQTNTNSTGNPSVATYSGTQTVTIGPTLTTTLYGGTLTTTVFATLPTGGSLTTVSSGSSTNSYYVYSTAASSLELGGGASLCFDCCLWPCIVTGMQAAATPSPEFLLARINRARQVTGAETSLGTCPTAQPGAGTTTIFRVVSTLTRCDAQPVCPSPGWGIIGQSNIPGASTIVTGNSHGTTSFVQFPTTSASSPMSLNPANSGPGSSRGSVRASSRVVLNTATSGAASSTGPPTPPNTALPTCPYSSGAVFTDYYGSQYRIQCDTLFTNTIISTQTQTRLSECIIACDKYSRDNIGGAKCAGASWISGQADDNCLLFDGSNGVPTRGTHSATLLTGLVTPPGNGGNDTSPSGVLTSIGSVITPTAIITSPPETDPYTSTVYGVSTAVSTVVGTDGHTSLITYGVTTAISQHVVNRLVTTLTVTATTVSVSMGISYIVSYIVSTAAGPTQTLQLGAGATVTIHDTTTLGIRTVFAGPTVTTYGGTRTETTTVGTAGTQTIHDISFAPTETTTVYIYPSSSVSSSYCRPFPTEYLHGAVPVKKRDTGVIEGLVDIGTYAPMLDRNDKPRALY
ncbi:hypothetical protein LTR56_010841 [Elasticomyces elasticus]|nr:hypothetical protein LTR56_010841 [Elasticomyces elasticus]KAK3650285.1 hypothetical protein LTR22_012612 [Elasticomyces elasticus]KAK5768304.1 hypothetical protein LTS12_001443 [Elasticomyces elasticus]